MPRPAGSICFVVGGLNDDAGPDVLSTARALARGGWQVHVLHDGGVTPPSDQPVRFWELSAFELPKSLRVPALNGSPALERSEHVRHALEAIHRSLGLDVVEVAGRGGLGFRALQARQAGLAFEGVRFIVRLGAPAGGQPVTPDELEQDFAERFTFENADHQVARDAGSAARAGEKCWHVRPELCALANAAEQFYQAVLAEGRPPVVRPTEPLVTLSVAYFNLGAFLEETLDSVAAQTYANVEVLVINDGSTDDRSARVFEAMRSKFPRFRFLHQENRGIGATRNRGLGEARGEYFIPVDADNVARPDMVRRFVTAMQQSPGAAAMSCFFLAFRESADVPREEFAYAYRPSGGPHVLASVRNVYGDANAIFHTETFRSVGGYETDRDTSFEDWEAFVKLANAGHQLEVVPDHLFYYRHRDAGFSRVTDQARNHRRVLRQFFRSERLAPAERVALWSAWVGLHHSLEELRAENRALRWRLRSLPHRLADRMASILGKVPFGRPVLRRLFGPGGKG